ncbi:ComF family protein [bacterium]|nr:ComF family protein [bacterium]
MELWKFFIDLLFPITCIGCGKEGSFICEKCKNEIFNLKQEKTRYIDKLISISSYNNPIIKKAIHTFKYKLAKEISTPLGEIMAERLKHFIPKELINRLILVPVPLNKRRLKYRGFNQSEILAKEISKHTKIPAISNILIRKINTIPQVKLKNPKERKSNIKGAFGINQNLPYSNFSFQKKIIILVDDVATTCATLNECAKTLKKLKPHQIWAIVIARG